MAKSRQAQGVLRICTKSGGEKKKESEDEGSIPQVNVWHGKFCAGHLEEVRVKREATVRGAYLVSATETFGGAEEARNRSHADAVRDAVEAAPDTRRGGAAGAAAQVYLTLEREIGREMLSSLVTHGVQAQRPSLVAAHGATGTKPLPINLEEHVQRLCTYDG